MAHRGRRIIVRQAETVVAVFVRRAQIHQHDVGTQHSALEPGVQRREMSGNHAQHAGFGQRPVAHRAETGEAENVSLFWLDSAAGEENLSRTDSTSLLEQFRDQGGWPGTPYDMVTGTDE